ncbi:MAG: 50S ribosomal protein L30 [Bacteroidota bacterium]
MAKIILTQVKSIIGRPEDQKRTIRALGFTKMNQIKEHEATPQVLGMVKKVAHLLKVKNA